MSVKDIIAKVVAGEPLSDEEREMLTAAESEPTAEAELPHLQARLESVEAERDAAQQELAELRFNHQVAELATRYGFTDPDYLGYLLNKRDISPDQAEEVEAFLAELKLQSPKLFRLELKAGTGTLPSPNAGNRNALVTSLADELIGRLEGAPEVKF